MKKFLPAGLLLLIALSINVFFRMGPAFLPFTKNSARDYVTADLIKEARQRIEEKFKDLPPQAKSRATQQLVDSLRKERKKSIDEAVLKRQEELKTEWQDKTGQTSLLEIDPYHWLRLVDNLSRYGTIGDKTIDGVRYDSFMLAPLGMKVEVSLHKNLHVYISYYLFKLVKMFRKNVSLAHFVFYIPVFISTLALILAFLLCLSITRTSANIAGFFTVISLGLAPIFLGRSLAGWFDTDAYVILFSLLSAWLFYLSLNYASPKVRRVLFAILGGLSIGLFSFTWDGWWYIFDLMILSALVYILNLYLTRKESPQEEIKLDVPLVSLGVFILSSLLFVAAFCGLIRAGQFLSGPVGIIFAKGYLQNQFWPNTFLTVEELIPDNLLGVINKSGGATVIYGLLYLIIALLHKKSKDYKYRQFIIIYFTLWILIMTYVSMKANRFALLLIIPVSVSFGLFWEWTIDAFNNFIRRLIKLPKINLKWVLFVMFCFFLVPLFLRPAFNLRNTAPAINKEWQEALNKMRQETPQDSIINSWWDYGHWFKAVAQRPVIFDGATQNTPMAYWMARFLLTNNETEAIGILRMLNSGSNKAFEELQHLGIDRHRCLDILNEIIVLEESDADKALAEFIPNQDQRRKILQYTHHPRAAYFIVEPSLMYKIRAISFLGNWDFRKADIYRKFRKFKKERFIEYLIKEQKYNQVDALGLYDFLIFLDTADALEWISSAYRYINELKSFRKEDSFIFFDNGFVVDVNTHNAYIIDAKDGKWKPPKKLFYFEDGTIKEKSLGGGEAFDFSLLLIQDKDNYRMLALDEQLVKSMLTRMYYFPELKLKHFKPFIKEELRDGVGSIIVYQINWKANE